MNISKLNFNHSLYTTVQHTYLQVALIVFILEVRENNKQQTLYMCMFSLCSYAMQRQQKNRA